MAKSLPTSARQAARPETTKRRRGWRRSRRLTRPEQRDGGLSRPRPTSMRSASCWRTRHRPAPDRPDRSNPRRRSLSEAPGAARAGTDHAPRAAWRIDNIVLKAIEAEPERRYASAGASPTTSSACLKAAGRGASAIAHIARAPSSATAAPWPRRCCSAGAHHGFRHCIGQASVARRRATAERKRRARMP